MSVAFAENVSNGPADGAARLQGSNTIRMGRWIPPSPLTYLSMRLFHEAGRRRGGRMVPVC